MHAIKRKCTSSRFQVCDIGVLVEQESSSYQLGFLFLRSCRTRSFLFMLFRECRRSDPFHSHWCHLSPSPPPLPPPLRVPFVATKSRPPARPPRVLQKSLVSPSYFISNTARVKVGLCPSVRSVQNKEGYKCEGLVCAFVSSRFASLPASPSPSPLPLLSNPAQPPPQRARIHT